ncbi:MAG: hypothetical protein ACR2HX_13330 [Pyrinomonadaceae bacterium]
MITVYVWLPKRIGNQKNVGHSAMLLGGLTYISWWPDEAAGFGRDYHPIRNKSYHSDVKDERCKPDWYVQLNGLDEKAILDWWANFGLTMGNIQLQGPLPPYNLATQNCSTVVANGLRVGGGNKYASWYSSWSLIWRPQAVLEYSLAIQQGLASKK